MSMYNSGRLIIKAVWLIPYVTDQALSKNVSNTITTPGYSSAERQYTSCSLYLYGRVIYYIVECTASFHYITKYANCVLHADLVRHVHILWLCCPV